VQNLDCNVRLVGRERMHDYRRRHLARGKHIRERLTNQRRRVVQQHDHRAFGGRAIIGRQIGMKIGARQSRRGVRALSGGRVAQPLQELTNNHAQPTPLWLATLRACRA